MNTEQELQQEDMILSPVEILFHVAGTYVQKIDTEQGTITTLSIISPTGFAVTVKMDDDNVEKLVNQLQGEKNLVDTYSALPPGLKA